MYRKEDLDILGLKEGFNRKDLEYAYSIMLKKAKYDPSFDVDRVNQAYSNLLDLKELPEISEEEKIKRQKRMRFTENRIFYVAGLLVIVIVFFVSLSAIKRKNIDLRICFVGEVFVEDRDALKELIRPDVSLNKTNIGNIYLTMGGDGEFSYNSTQSLIFSLLAGDFDLLICDYEALSFLTADINDFLILDLYEFFGDANEEFNKKDFNYISFYQIPFAIKMDKSYINEEYLNTYKDLYLCVPLKVKNIENVLETIYHLREINND